LKSIVKRKNKKISSVFYLTLFFLLLLSILGLFAPDFYSINNIIGILNRMSYILIASLGMNLIILTGNIDISAGALISVVCLTVAAVGKTGANTLILFLVSMTTGAILSFINSLLVTKLLIPATVATLATSQLFAGVLPLVVEGSIYDLPSSFTWLGFDAKLFHFFPVSIVIMIVITLMMLFVMKHTGFSKKLYAVGNNHQAARYAGVNVDNTIMLAYIVAGILFGISATIISTASQRVTTTMGSGLEMNLIAAVVLGGTSVSGGKGRITGTVLGSAILTLLGPAINYLGISSDWTDAITGIIIIVSVVSSEWKILKDEKIGTRVFNYEN